MSGIFAKFKAKKAEPDSGTLPNQQNPLPDPQGAKQDPPQENGGGGAPNIFGDLTFKKPAGGTTAGTKPKGFDPFNIGATPKTNQNPSFQSTTEPGSFAQYNQEIQSNPNPISGQGSLNRLDGDETPSSINEGLEGKKASPFGFIHKTPKKLQSNEPQNLSFVTNANTSAQVVNFGNRGYEGENAELRSNPEIEGKRGSMTSLSSEPNTATATTGKSAGTAFSFIKKKSNVAPEPESQFFTKKRPSITLDSSSQPEVDAGSETRSENIEGRSAASPSGTGNRSFGGPSFMKFKSPGSVDPFRQSEDSSFQNQEARSEHPENSENLDRGSESGSIKSSGPSFMKFKQKFGGGQSQESPKRNEDTSARKSQASNKEEERNDEYIKPEAVDTKAYRNEGIGSPFMQVQTPAILKEEKPKDVKSRLERNEGDLLEAIGDLVVRQNGLMGKKSSLESQKENLSKKLKNVADQQNQAIETENFEEADHLEVVILELNESLRDLEKQIDDCQMEFANLEKEKQKIYQKQVSLYRNSIGDIENIVLAQAHDFEKYRLDCLNQQNSEKTYIEEKTKELQYNRNHIDLDLKHINEETNQINENMDRQIKDYASEEKDLAARKLELETIVEQIRRELQAKEAELSDVSKSLNRVTTKITSIKSKFDDQVTRISKKREKVDAEESQYQKDMKNLKEHQERADNGAKRLEEVTQNHQKAIREYEELKVNLRNDSQKLDQENTRRERAIKLYYDSLNDLRMEKRQLSSFEDQIDNLKEDLNKFHSHIDSLTSQKNSLNNQIPELEKEKKAFVASKSFKDASRVSNEIKDIQTKIAEIEGQLQQIADDEKSTINKIQTLEKETIPALNQKVIESARECDLNQHELLKVKEKDLLQIYSYYQTQRLFEEAHLIEVELKAAQKQLAQLASKYPQLKADENVDEVAAEQIHNQPETETQLLEEPVNNEEVAERVDEVEQHYEEQNGETDLLGGHTEIAEAAPVEHKEISLPELVAEYEELTKKIDDLEVQINQFAEEEKYEEADEATNQQEAFKSRQNEINILFQDKGLNTIEEVKEEIARTANQEEEKVEIHNEEGEHQQEQEPIIQEEENVEKIQEEEQAPEVVNGDENNENLISNEEQ